MTPDRSLRRPVRAASFEEFDRLVCEYAAAGIRIDRAEKVGIDEWVLYLENPHPTSESDAA